jgi:Mor family transcriptional regulator
MTTFLTEMREILARETFNELNLAFKKIEVDKSEIREIISKVSENISNKVFASIMQNRGGQQIYMAETSTSFAANTIYAPSKSE